MRHINNKKQQNTSFIYNEISQQVNLQEIKTHRQIQKKTLMEQLTNILLKKKKIEINTYKLHVCIISFKVLE